MEKILISSCLLGQKVRYDGAHCLLQNSIITQWKQEGVLISFCPEQASGLPTPRPAAEIQGDTVLSIEGEDLGQEFTLGAQLASSLSKDHGIRMAILKEKSPSCGVHEIYDGSFQGKVISGSGITTQALQKMGVKVFSEHELEAANKYYQHLLNSQS
jgi:uncharacterized protein YbbK (DUF523 family)